MGDVARKVMGDVPISYIEGVGGTRVSEEDVVAVGKHDVRSLKTPISHTYANSFNSRSCHSRWVGKPSYSMYIQSRMED